jgi:hypothetical protein
MRLRIVLRLLSILSRNCFRRRRLTEKIARLGKLKIIGFRRGIGLVTIDLFSSTNGLSTTPNSREANLSKVLSPAL